MPDAEADDDGMHFPAVMTINGISDIKTDDHKALVIRLELPYVEYYDMEKVIQIGIESLQKRYRDLGKLARDAEKGEATLTEPLTVRDIDRAASAALHEANLAETLLMKIRRPKD